MSLLKANSVQIGQSSTATNNFTLSVPASPDGTIKLARGNSGATTADVLTVNASGAITGATISGATINSSTLNGGSITLGTAQNSTSGTAIDFTGIPSWAKRISVMFNGVSISGTANILIQIGTSSGIDSSGYLSASVHSVSGNVVGGTSSSSGFILHMNSASNVTSGIATIVNIGSNTLSMSYCGCLTNTTAAHTGGGNKTFTGTLDRIRVTSSNGTDTFDAGSINIMYEG